MRKLTLILVLIIISIGCKSEPKKIDQISEENKAESDYGLKEFQEFTHLKDTIEISGKTILILRPDSLRFQSYFP